MILCSSKNLTLPKPEEPFFSDLLVVGGGCSGLAAISAAADLGIESCILLEKEEILGGRLGKSVEALQGLFSKAVYPKDLLAHFSLFLENYGIIHQEGVEAEALYLLSENLTLQEAFQKDGDSSYPYLLKVKSKDGEFFFATKTLILAMGKLNSEEEASLASLFEKEKNVTSPRIFPAGQSLKPSQSIVEAVQSGGAVGRKVGEILLKEKHKPRS